MTLKQFKKIADKISPVNNVVEIQSGFNLYIEGKTYSFYYPKKGQNKIVHNTRVLKFSDKQEFAAFNVLQEELKRPLFPRPQINRLVREGEPEVPTYKIAVPAQNSKNHKLTLSTKGILAKEGTQACIDHVQRKIAKIEADTTRNNTSLIVMLKNIVDELKQYL